MSTYAREPGLNETDKGPCVQRGCALAGETEHTQITQIWRNCKKLRAMAKITWARRERMSRIQKELWARDSREAKQRPGVRAAPCKRWKNVPGRQYSKF